MAVVVSDMHCAPKTTSSLRTALLWTEVCYFVLVLWLKGKSHEVVAHAFVLPFEFFFIFFVVFFCLRCFRRGSPPEGVALRKFVEEARLPRRRPRRRCTSFFPRHASAVASAGALRRRRAPSTRRWVPPSLAQGRCTHHHRLSDEEVDFSIFPLFSSTNFF